MAVWNLTEFSELENSVLTRYEHEPGKQSDRRKTFRIGRVLAMVAAATVFTVTNVEASSGTFSSPISVMVFAQSGIEQKPPLEHLFAFGGQLSEELELPLLAKLELGRRVLSKDELYEQAIESIFYNQQEDVSGEADRLSRKEIEKIVKQRKLV
jgi:hypothetical protein